MNAEEAKVPNVDGDWQSIEIFLFSNGQQYSPPRKYFLEADDLNSWEATLNQLALSQYGLQSPQIDLYTTDGQLVEGPLELKDGHAYVAVAQTNTFIDAGYQKYLLKASRSWEKRQARLKVPECIPGEPCCLCPEKDWCCDLQKCCLCAEKEDLSESFSSATDHKELRTAGGQFMSSPPTKLEHSSKIGATGGTHEVKSKEYGTNPAEHGYSSIEIQAKPNEYGAKPDDYGSRSDEYGVKPSEYNATLDEIGPRINKNGAMSREYRSELSENGAWTSQDEAREPVDSEPCIMEKTFSDSKDKPDKDTGDTDVGIKCHECPFQEQSSTLSPIGESDLEKKDEYSAEEGYPKDKEIQLIELKEGDCICSINGNEKSNRAKDTGTKDKLSQQRVTEIDHKRRSSELKKGGIEKEGKTSEPIRELEFGGRENKPKSKETEPTSRPVGQITGENRIRLSEQRKRQSGHAARLSVLENRVENHDDGLRNSGLGVSEPSAKSAPLGSKASSREKFSSRIKKLGHNKMVVPNTIADEAATKESDESDIKDKVISSQITETQQHAPKNSFSAGRQSTDKKRPLSGQNSSLLRKTTPTPSLSRKSEDKKPLKTNKDLAPKKIFGNSSSVPVSSLGEKPKAMPKVPYRRETPPALPQPTISFTSLIRKQENIATDKDPPENVTDEQDLTEESSIIFRNGEAEFKSFGLGTSKLVNFIERYSKATQTELNVEKSMPCTVSEGVQTNTEAVEQQGKEICSQRDYRIATVDPDENIISIINKGDIINLKLNIEVRNIVRSVHSSEKNSPKSRSLTKITNSEKESQISIDDKTLVQNNALQDLVNDQHFQGCGFEGSPKVMIVQCAGCGPLNNPPRRESPPCCDNDKKYLVLLTNSAPEDNTNDNSICSTLCRASGQKQSQSRRQGGGGISANNTFSEITLDTITTVTVSGGPLKKREMGNCPTTNTTCRTEDMQNELVATKRRVNITKDSGTKGSFHKQSVSSLSVTYFENLPNGIKTGKYEEMQVMSELYSPLNPATCQKEQSVCSKATLQTSPEAQSKGCQPTSQQVQSQGCTPPPPKCPPCCPTPPPKLVSPQGCIPPTPPKCPSHSAVPPSTPGCPQACMPPCCPKTVSKPVCPQACSPPTPPPPCCHKPSSVPVCPQPCLPLSTPPPCCPKPVSKPVCPQACPPPTPPPPCCHKPSSVPVRPQACLPLSTPPPCCPNAVSKPVCPQACLPPTTPPPCHKPSSLPVYSQAYIPPPSCPKPLATPACPQGCLQPSPTCPSCCPAPLPCIQIQTQVCPSCIPQVADSETQTQWARIVARRHYDGRYSFHLPPLNYLNNNPA